MGNVTVAPARGGRRDRSPARIGVYGVGHSTYWSQFPGLKDELLGYLDRFIGVLRDDTIELVNFGLVDDARSAYAAVERMKEANLDLLFCDMLTYATSATFAVIQRELTIPIVLVALQPLRSLRYDSCSTYLQLCNDNICSLPEFVGVAKRLGRRVPRSVIGYLGEDGRAAEELRRYVAIAKAIHDLRRARIGHFGHPLESMYDMHVDQTSLTRAFGCHVVQTEIDDLEGCFRDASPAAVAEARGKILHMFDTPEPKNDPITEKLTERDLDYSSRVAAALDLFASRFDLDGLAYYHQGLVGSERERLASNLVVGNSLLLASGFPVCGESDLKTNIAMFIMDRLGMGGSFAELHPIDFDAGVILVGHDGPHHVSVAEGRPVLRSLKVFHGKSGSGASVEFKLKVGAITMLGLNSDSEGRFKFIVAEGESMDGPIPPTGNTNTRGYFYRDPRDFLAAWLAAGPTHHFSLGIGHESSSLEILSEFLDLDIEVVNRKPSEPNERSR